MNEAQIVVIDLDGTLCNSKHREHLAVAGQWDEFHSMLGDDEPWADTKGLLDILYGAGIGVVGLTGRNEKFRNSTLDWLTKNDIWLDELMMRPDNNYMPDHELKPKMLEDKHEKDDILFILEDRDKVVEAWRNLGYNCWQVRPGGY